MAENVRFSLYHNVSNRSVLGKGLEIKTFENPGETHIWKYVRFGDDGWLYYSINSPCNTCLKPEFGRLLKMKPVLKSLKNTFLI